MLSVFFQAEDGIRDLTVTGVQTCALPISVPRAAARSRLSRRRRDARGEAIRRKRNTMGPARVCPRAQPAHALLQRPPPRPLKVTHANEVPKKTVFGCLKFVARSPPHIAR